MHSKRSCLTTLLVLAIAAYNGTSKVAVCSLPDSALYIAIDSTLVACVASKSTAFSARCRTACSCRRLEIGRSAYGVCLNSSATFYCDAAENATRCTQVETTSSAASIARKLLSSDSSGGIELKTWQWALVGLAIALVLGLLLFMSNFFKNRPLRGDNRREVTQTLDLHQPQVDADMLHNVLFKSQTRTATGLRSTTHSRDTNPSQMSGFSGGSYRTHAGNLISSTLTYTEIGTQHQERVFSPASSHSARSSDCSQGVESSPMKNLALLGREDSSESDRRPYSSHSSYSISSDMGSFSSQLTVDGSDTDTGERARKSIEF